MQEEWKLAVDMPVHIGTYACSDAVMRFCTKKFKGSIRRNTAATVVMISDTIITPAGLRDSAVLNSRAHYDRFNQVI